MIVETRAEYDPRYAAELPRHRPILVSTLHAGEALTKEQIEMLKRVHERHVCETARKGTWLNRT